MVKEFQQWYLIYSFCVFRSDDSAISQRKFEEGVLKKLQKEYGVTIIFIAHDLGVVKYLSTKVAVMYLGRVVEIAPAEQLYNCPMHPYTQALISAIPIPDPAMEKSRKKIPIQGEIPSPLNPPIGCAFASRCPLAQGRCFSERPSLDEVIPGQKVACHFTPVK